MPLPGALLGGRERNRRTATTGATPLRVGYLGMTIQPVVTADTYRGHYLLYEHFKTCPRALNHTGYGHHPACLTCNLLTTVAVDGSDSLSRLRSYNTTAIALLLSLVLRPALLRDVQVRVTPTPHHTGLLLVWWTHAYSTRTRLTMGDHLPNHRTPHAGGYRFGWCREPLVVGAWAGAW